jgi:hypothetical protein
MRIRNKQDFITLNDGVGEVHVYYGDELDRVIHTLQMYRYEREAMTDAYEEVLADDTRYYGH